MRFPDLLVQVKRLEERVRLVEFDLLTLRQDLVRAFPEARSYLGVQPGQSTVESPVDSDSDSPGETPGQLSIDFSEGRKRGRKA